MRERVALLRQIVEQGDARVRGDMLSMRRKLRYQEDRATIRRAGDVDERCERGTRLRHQRRQRSPARRAQEPLGLGDGIEFLAFGLIFGRIGTCHGEVLVSGRRNLKLCF